MYTQIELLDLIASFNESITGQTLRNYIKARVCEGAYQAINGISNRGIVALYFRRTAFQAIIAKNLRLSNGRKRTMKEISFAYLLADRIITDDSVDMIDDKAFRDVAEKIVVHDFNGVIEVDKTSDGDMLASSYVTLDSDKKVTRRLSDLKSLTGEWLLLMAGLQFYDLHGRSNGSISPVEAAKKTIVVAQNPYSISLIYNPARKITEVVFEKTKLDDDFVKFTPKDRTIWYKGKGWIYK